ncbi:hypothetical protein CCM_03675 [Cordyceps militaris CM01]|uniref:Uncharacterized protein n=1 Tax=Cordyceps militaris (strain CM01) TaxID=983644 RepID=G3JFS0_CORMM|nr:uncharacterized protein CCM_03675 [Cordyceps militaris CM01]EGX92303.1 hypothetical protein CCM_03675 [Cordyceps militaris CM01]
MGNCIAHLLLERPRLGLDKLRLKLSDPTEAEKDSCHLSSAPFFMAESTAETCSQSTPTTMKIPAALARSLLATVSWPFSRDDVHARDRCDNVRTKCKIEIERFLNLCLDTTQQRHWTPDESDKFCKNWNASDWAWQQNTGLLKHWGDNPGWAWQTPGPWMDPEKFLFYPRKCVSRNTSSSSSSSSTPDAPRPPGWHYPDSVPRLRPGPATVFGIREVLLVTEDFPTKIQEPDGSTLIMHDGIMDLALCVSRLNC